MKTRLLPPPNIPLAVRRTAKYTPRQYNSTPDHPSDLPRDRQLSGARERANAACANALWTCVASDGTQESTCRGDGFRNASHDALMALRSRAAIASSARGDQRLTITAAPNQHTILGEAGALRRSVRGRSVPPPAARNPQPERRQNVGTLVATLLSHGVFDCHSLPSEP